MTELETIQHKAQEVKLEFLLIGGLAVIQHGFVRSTTDIDLLVRMRDSESWRRMLEGLGYRYDHGTHNFHQYQRREFTGWPLDLMIVDESTFEKLAKGSVPTN